MAKNENFSKRVTTPKFRMSFPNLETPDNIMGSKDKFYSCQMLFDKKQGDEWIQTILKELYKQKWGDKKRGTLFKNPWRDGDVKAEESEMEVYLGQMIMNAKAGEKDKLLFLDGQKNPIGPNDFYAGCYCKAVIELRTFDNQYGQGISCWLRGLQFIEDGEALGGASMARADDFEVVEGSKAKNEIADDDF